MSIQSIFNPPNQMNNAGDAPAQCCNCNGQQTNVNVDLTNGFNPINPDGTVATRMDQAAKIIKNAQKQGFVVFQGN